MVASSLWLGGCATMTIAVREQASRDLECPEQQLDVERHETRFVVEGCGQRSAYVCSREGYARSCKRVGRSGVPVARRESIVRAKASQLLDCDAASLAIEADGERYLARGCGRRITYECATRGDCCAFTKPGAQPDAPSEATEERFSSDERELAHGSLSKAHIRAVINADIQRVRACYEAELQQAEGHAGIVSVQFIIAPDGHVQAAAIHASSLGVPRAEQCILEAMKRLRFAEPAGGGIVVVTYPFTLIQDQPGPDVMCP